MFSFVNYISFISYGWTEGPMVLKLGSSLYWGEPMAFVSMPFSVTMGIPCYSHKVDQLGLYLVVTMAEGSCFPRGTLCR